MNLPRPQSTAKIAGHPIHPMLVPFPIAFFVSALVCDVAYAQSGITFWFTAGRWLIGAGLATAALAAVAGLTDFFGSRQIRSIGTAWRHMIGNVTVVVIELINLWQRFDTGAAFITPVGLIMSAVAALLLLYTGWLGGELVYRYRVGGAPEPATPVEHLGTESRP